MKELIGKTVTAISIGAGEDCLVFWHPDGGYTAYETDADCCSETWFADIVGVCNLIGQEVVTAEEIDMPDDAQDDRCRQEHDQFYGVKLTTAKGHIDIVYRNSSNGYYGGSIELATRGIPEAALRGITEDFSA